MTWSAKWVTVVVLVSLLFLSMIAGDAVISQIAYDSHNSKICTTPPITIYRAYKFVDISSAIGIARFRVGINWIVFVILTLFSILLIKDYKKYRLSRGLYILSTILLILLWLFLLVCGIFISKYVF